MKNIFKAVDAPDNLLINGAVELQAVIDKLNETVKVTLSDSSSRALIIIMPYQIRCGSF